MLFGACSRVQVVGNVREGHITLNLERSEQALWLGRCLVLPRRRLISSTTLCTTRVLTMAPSWLEARGGLSAHGLATESRGPSHSLWCSTLAAGI